MLLLNPDALADVLALIGALGFATSALAIVASEALRAIRDHDKLIRRRIIGGGR